VNIYVLNKSTVLSDKEIQGWIPAFYQFIKDVRRYWPRPANIVWCSKDKEPAEAWKLVFADVSDEAGALGYHDFTPGGRPVSYVFAKDDISDGYSPTVTATHEIAEMIADPWISELFQVSNQYNYAKEIGDPVEADNYGYEITVPGFDPVLCSDFVLPNWFIPGSPPKYDHTGNVTQPLQILSGGYMSVQSTGAWNQIDHEGNIADKSKRGYGRLERYGRDRGDHPYRIADGGIN